MAKGGGRAPSWWVPALLAAAGLAAYARSFTVPFQFDDQPTLVERAQVHLTRLDWASLAPLLAGFRPLAMLTFGLNHRLGGMDPAGWHAVNLTIHVAAALVAWLLAGELLRRVGWDDGARRGRAALLAALLFLLHPVQTQAVTYVVQRMASMAGLLALLATWLWLRGRRSPRPAGWLAGAGLAWVAAVLTKENTLVLPLVVAGTEALLSPELPAWLRRRRLPVLAGAAAAAALGIWMVSRYWTTIQSEQVRFGLSVGDRLLTQSRVVALYLSLLAWPLPSRLRVDYDFPPSHGLLTPPATLLALAALAALVVLAWRLRRRQPLVSFAVLWFLGNLAVENSFLPVDLVFEQRLYLPSFGPFLLAAATAVEALERWLGPRPARSWLAVAPVLALLGVATDRRNALWNDPAALHAQVLADQPGNVLSLLTVGKEAMDRGDVDGAERSFRAVLALQPSNPRALGNMGNVARARGELPQAERWYRRSLAVANGEDAPREGLGVVLAEQGRSAEAEREFRTIVEHDPRNARALTDLGTLRAQRGDLPGALDWYARGAAADPASAFPLVGRARTLLAAGRAVEALASAEEALRREPGDGDALALAGESLARLGRGPEAVARWRELARLQPGRRGIHFAIGNVLQQAGDLAGAAREYQAELAVAPHSGALTNLGNLAAESDPARARALYQQALQVDPRNAAAAQNLKVLGGGR